MSQPLPTITHQSEQQRFVIPIADLIATWPDKIDNEDAVLAYKLQQVDNDETVIDFYSTYCPVAFRGTGVSEYLVKHGLDWARAQNYKIVASCWYVEKFL